jgi:hypothetical protein
MDGKRSPRQRLREATEAGRLRSALEYGRDRTSLDGEVIDLIVDVCLRYCAPRRRPGKPARRARLSVVRP